MRSSEATEILKNFNWTPQWSLLVQEIPQFDIVTIRTLYALHSDITRVSGTLHDHSCVVISNPCYTVPRIYFDCHRGNIQGRFPFWSK